LVNKVCKIATNVFIKYLHCIGVQFPVATEYGSMEQLEVLYEVRVREVQRLAQQVEELKQQAVQEKDQLYRRLALAQAEKEHVTLQHAQSAKNLGK
jgi:hypothetical protein